MNDFSKRRQSVKLNTDKIKEESKSKVEEYNIWLETKEKIEKAIS